jgi:GMP synthase-like glutamine amidotransferase
MKLAILETGHPPGDLVSRFGNYPAMFAQMLGHEFDIESFDVQSGELPSDPAAHHAYLITGSPAGVYDPLPWIEPLQEFIRSAKDSRMVGVCFGHQIMSEALGGHVEKSEKGWAAGLHRYSVERREPWMDGDASATITAPASHQD